MEIKEDGIVFNIENKITIPNEVYKQLLINDYKYKTLLNIIGEFIKLDDGELKIESWDKDTYLDKRIIYFIQENEPQIGLTLKSMKEEMEKENE